MLHLLKRAVVLAPEDAEARFALAEGLFGAGELVLARKQLEKLFQLNADHPNGRRLMAKVSAALGQKPDTSHPESYWPAAERFAEMGRLDDAILFGEAHCRRAGDAQQWSMLAEWCVRQEFLLLAKFAFGRALSLSSGKPELVRERDRLLSKLGEDDGVDLLSDFSEGALTEALAALAERDVLAAKRALATASEFEKQTATFHRIRAELLLAENPTDAAAQSALAKAQTFDSRPYHAGRLAKALDTRAAGKIGVLGWTPVGGGVSPLEAVAVIGQGTLKFTGNVGETGREAGLVAYTCLKALSTELKIDGLIATFDLHLHFTDIHLGKEGQSSGLALTLAGLSAFRKKPLWPQLAATGSITLGGEVQRVEGIYEKMVAARLAGMKRVLYPRGNSQDVRELPALVREKLELLPVSSLQEAMGLAFRAVPS